MKKTRRMCLQCLFKRLRRRLFPKHIDSREQVKFEDQVTATLIKDGRVIKKIVGSKKHNKWINVAERGLDNVVLCLIYGGTSTNYVLKVVSMHLGSQCSDTSFTDLGAAVQTPTNTHPAVSQGKWTATWAASGAINGICQVKIRCRNYAGTADTDAAIYNFGTPFNKPDGISLKIEWTTTLSS